MCIFAPNKLPMKLFLFAIPFFSLTTFAQTSVLQEDFQSGLPANWTMIQADANTPAPAVQEYTEAWILKTDPADSMDTVVSSTSFFSPSGQANRWLITPAITLGAYGNEFSWNAKSHDASFPDDYKVLLSTTGNTMTDFTDTIGSILQENAEWTNRKVNLSNLGYNSQTIYVAFVLRTNDGFKLYVDDVLASKEDPAGLNQLTSVKAQLLTLDNHKYKLSSQSVVIKISIYNLQGVEVISTSQDQFDLSPFTSGMFVVRVDTENGSATWKIQKD